MLMVQGRNVVLESKYGSPRIVNDGVTVAKEVELEDPVENIGAKLVRQVCCSPRVGLIHALLCLARPSGQRHDVTSRMNLCHNFAWFAKERL